MPRWTRDRRWIILCALLATAPAGGQAQSSTLSNGRVSASFGDRGLAAIADAAIGASYRFRADDFLLVIDGRTIDSRTLDRPERRREGDSVVFAWNAEPYRLETRYHIRPGWRFVAKDLVVVGAGGDSYRLERIAPLRAELGEPAIDTYAPRSPRPDLGTGDYGISLRLARGRALLALVQNPFLETRAAQAAFEVAYAPAMTWRAADGPFIADRALLVPARLTGRRVPARMIPEWALPDAAPTGDDAGDGMDEAEVAAFTDAVRASLLYRPAKPVDIVIGWCSNDYQIDIATPEGRAEYRRLIDRAAEVGAEHLLFAPSHTGLARREESIDDWSWEHVLWMGLGQRMRKGEWDPRRDELPAEVRELVEYARGRGVGLVAYVYPVLPLAREPSWLVPGRDAQRPRANLAARGYQDWLVDTLVAFHRRAGTSGFAFDHTFLTYDGASRYAQWWGWRRILEELRRRLPEIVIDGRQAYHLYGPWSWLAGSYPHPTFSDEQPESFTPFPDLHIDRVSAARQRYTAYRYRMYEFAPSEIVPGFMTHQTPRNDDTGHMPQTTTPRGVVLERFRARDWDLLGWRYSVISSIATGGWNNVLNMLPARDPEEFRHFSPADRAWLREWLDWTAANAELLRRTRPILGQPAIGRVDGTAAIANDRGYVFLFNPNARRLAAELSLDDRIGLTARGPFLLRERYPLDRLVGKPGEGWWRAGDRVTLPMAGASALVLEIAPAPAAIDQPLLFNVPGRVEVVEDTLRLEGMRGEIGTTTDVLIRLPADTTVRAVEAAGVRLAFTQVSPRVVTASVRFAGEAFGPLHPVIEYDPQFRGGLARGRLRLPRRIVDQLAARRRAWPIPWTPEDYRTPWLAPDRLLLFVQIAEPDDRLPVRLRLDGRPVALHQAYSAVRPARHTFVGFYADISLLHPDRDYEVELELPPLRPGQLQGLFVENVEAEYTSAIGGA
ncbi:MAG TPA: hypothetical protein VNI83_05945 [Vicinamibacterales bacterium]|nr:hypothetical protein [Vicinamibacterales bacterium]